MIYSLPNSLIFFSCSYLQTLSHEKQQTRVFHQGLLKIPEEMMKIQVYDLNENRIVQLPYNSKGHRLSIVFFYLTRCVPSMTHLNYFSAYASASRTQVIIYFYLQLIISLRLKYNYISINCDRSDLDQLKDLTQGFGHIRSYTDFAPEEFECEKKMSYSILFLSFLHR